MVVSYIYPQCESQETLSNPYISSVLPLLLAALGLQVVAGLVQVVSLSEMIRVVATGLLVGAYCRSPKGWELQRTCGRGS
eukprot:symbB.v1.2.002289.t1/scaffold107.1/size327550/5